MDSARFDTLTRLLANRTSRRTTFAAAAAAALTPVIAGAQDATPVAVEASPVPVLDDDFPVFLFVQTFTQGSWQPGGEDGLYTLTLSGVSSGTIAFSDRPERIVTLVPMQTFLNGLGFTPSNPPNAALVIGTDDGASVVILELTAPVYDADTATLTYITKILAIDTLEASGYGFTTDPLGPDTYPPEFGPASLFIDSLLNCSPWDTHDC